METSAKNRYKTHVLKIKQQLSTVIVPRINYYYCHWSAVWSRIRYLILTKIR